jgi:hypothetical protein
MECNYLIVTTLTMLKCAISGLASFLACGWCSAAGAETTTLDVHFKLTDIDYKPLPNVPVRLIFGCDNDWQSKDAGRKFATDEKGEAHFTADVVLDKRWRKIPTNFVDSLMSVPHPREHLLAGAALDYMGFNAIYAVDIVCLPGGTTMQDNFTLYAADASGNFTREVDPRNYASLRPDLGRVVLRGPGYEPWDYSLLPTEDSKHWTLKLAFKKSPPPIPLDEHGSVALPR